MEVLKKNIIKVNTMIPSNPLIPVPFRVEAIKQEIADTFTLNLLPNGEGGSFAFLPGQFNMLYVFGHGEVPISMSGDPSDPNRLVHTIRNVGGVTSALQNIKAGDYLGVRGPYGRPWPMEATKGKHVLIMAGGLGIAPLRPCIYQLLSSGQNAASVTILYGTRSPDTILYEKELKKWAEQVKVGLTVDNSTTKWDGHVGVVTDLLKYLTMDTQNLVAFICGPEIMMRFSAYALIDRGVAASDIYVSMERNMKCALGFCGRCQYGPHFVCKDGPVFSFDEVKHLFKIREV